MAPAVNLDGSRCRPEAVVCYRQGRAVDGIARERIIRAMNCPPCPVGLRGGVWDQGQGSAHDLGFVVADLPLDLTPNV